MEDPLNGEEETKVTRATIVCGVPMLKEERVLIGSYFPLVADGLGISPSCLVILARFPIAAVGSSLVSSGEFLVQQTYVGILPGAFCCASNFASF